MFSCNNHQLSHIPRIPWTSERSSKAPRSTLRECLVVREHLGLGMRERKEIGRRIARPGWLDYSKVAFSHANGETSTSKPAARAAAVEEEEDEDDEGPVQLTAAYRSLQFDVKRLKERLRYISKKWEMKNISICEEDREATEHRQDSSVENTSVRCTVSCTAVNHEAIVVHQEPQSVVISPVTPQLVRVNSITIETVLPAVTQPLTMSTST